MYQSPYSAQWAGRYYMTNGYLAPTPWSANSDVTKPWVLESYVLCDKLWVAIYLTRSWANFHDNLSDLCPSYRLAIIIHGYKQNNNYL